MTDNATPKKKRPTYSRPTKYPAALPRIMTTTEQRDHVDAFRLRADATYGEVIRELVDDGLALREAFDSQPALRAEVEKLAREGGVTVPEALATMLAFSAREARRRVKRNAELAGAFMQHFAEGGAPVDGVSVDGVDVHFEGL
jgi:hypothetical protein